MPRRIHEIRDPIHVFVRLDGDERKVLDSRPFQRLRYIHQLALTHLVYPGATHKRLEHSLGVMELAGRVFDIVTNTDNVTDEVRSLLDPLKNPDQLAYWRRVLRMAALCHDVGPLPFSHAAEQELLPEGWDHERLTREIICSGEMRPIWDHVTPPLRPNDIMKLAIGPKKAPDLDFTDWEAILSEIIVGDAFGVDRMDYLLRDSHHAGVAYGRFDHYRLVDTLRILTIDSQGSREPVLGVEEGGIQSTEALMLARYFMYSQVYFHPVRRIYDIHLKDFLKEWLEDGAFSTDIDKHLTMSDDEIMVALRNASMQQKARGHVHACRIMERRHFKRVYERNADDVAVNPESGRAVFDAMCGEFGEDTVRRDYYHQQGGSPDFPVRMRDGRKVSSLKASRALEQVPVTSVDYVFVDRSIFSEAEKWLAGNREHIIQLPAENEGDARDG